jgi:hypothetical protein
MPFNPKSLENLKRGNRFAKGQVNNPRGRPKRAFTLSDIARDKLGERVPSDKDKRTWARFIVDKWFTAIAEGNTSALIELLQRLEGKVALPLQASVDARSVVINVVVDSEESRALVAKVLAGDRTGSLVAGSKIIEDSKNVNPSQNQSSENEETTRGSPVGDPIAVCESSIENKVTLPKISPEREIGLCQVEGGS